MAICVPMRELKNTAEFTEAVCSADEPVVVTKNGREAFVSMSMDVYESLRLEAARAELYRAVDRAEADIAAGRTAEAHASNATAKAHHGL